MTGSIASDRQPPGKRRRVDHDPHQLVSTSSETYYHHGEINYSAHSQYTEITYPLPTYDLAESSVYDNVTSPLSNSHLETQHESSNDHAVQYSNCDDQVCFGMFTIDEIKTSEHASQLLKAGLTEVDLHGDRLCIINSVTSKIENEIGKILDGSGAAAIAKLQQHHSVLLEAYCLREHVLKHGRRRKSTLSCLIRLLVNVYGPRHLYEFMGKFFDSARMHLQDPVQCTLNVPYLNPHVLADDEAESVALTTGNSKPLSQIQDFVSADDLFSQLVTTENLPEAKPPSAIRTPLHRHQRQALYFMQQKEQGYLLNPSTGECRPYHFATSTDVLPKQLVRGGIIADQMGLGKTLQVISLIASDLDRSNQTFALDRPSLGLCKRTCLVATTLVILPLSLLQTWTEQLAIHVKSGKLKISTFYGPKRSLNITAIEQYDVILTTYDTVVAETQRQRSSHHESVLASVTWRRIVLDEAHCIRNTNSKRASCVCDLDALTYWAITGTPIQNRLMDLHALLQFIRASPYDNPGTFDTSIIRPWKTSLDSSAVTILKSLVKSVTIRRTKTSVHLPPRTDLIRHIDFDATERQCYEATKTRLKDDASALTDDQENNSVNILRWIDSLRQMCSFGTTSTKDSGVFTNHPGLSPDYRLDDMTDFNFELAQLDDQDFMLDIDFLSTSIDWEEPFTVPGQAWSADDNHLRSDYLQLPSRNRSTPGASSPMSESISDWGDIKTISSKTQALLTDITCHDGKSVIFSFWRKTLSLISETLEAAGIQCLILDGSKSIDDRNITIDTFRSQPDIKVLLSTISAGGVGLDLTIANQVCLMEPQWNPTTEEQALSRVHRMNQSQSVRTIRYVIKDSIEENVLELQRRKVELASLAFDSSRKQTAKELLHDLKLLL